MNADEIALEVMKEWLGIFDPAPTLNFQQSEMLQMGIADALREYGDERHTAGFNAARDGAVEIARAETRSALADGLQPTPVRTRIQTAKRIATAIAGMKPATKEQSDD